MKCVSVARSAGIEAYEVEGTNVLHPVIRITKPVYKVDRMLLLFEHCRKTTKADGESLLRHREVWR